MVQSSHTRDIAAVYSQTARSLTQRHTNSAQSSPISAEDYLRAVRANFEAFRDFIETGNHDVRLSQLPDGWLTDHDAVFSATGLRVLMHNWANLQGLALRPDIMQPEPASVFPGQPLEIPSDHDHPLRDVFLQFGQSMALFHAQARHDNKPAPVLAQIDQFRETMCDLTTRLAAGRPDLPFLHDVLAQPLLPARQHGGALTLGLN